MSNANEIHIIINSNKWFSAVSAYSWELAKYLQVNHKVEIWAHKESPLGLKSKEKKFKHIIFPILHKGIIGKINCWFILTKAIKELNKHKSVIWVFEGREHTLCAIHKKIHKNKWSNIKLIRVRGQAATVKNNLFSKWVYTNGVNGVVLASKVIESKIPFKLKNFIYHPFCSEIPTPQEINEDVPSWFPRNTLNFLILGRFDPVKNHLLSIESYHLCDFKNLETSLICIGRSENIKFAELVSFTSRFFPKKVYISEKICLLKNEIDSKKIYIIDEKYENIFRFINKCHFGIIPSLDSEVICRVAVEFLFLGKPLIVSNVGNLPDVVKGAPSFIIDPHSKSDYLKKLALSADLFLNSKYYETSCKSCLIYGQENFSSSMYDSLRRWALDEGR